jgi:hypothetical protein
MGRRWSWTAAAMAVLVPVFAFALTLGPRAASAATSWTVVDAPSVPSGELLDVAGSSRSDVWAVGSWFRAPISAFLSLAMHFDGTSWHVVHTPSEGRWNQFRGVAVLSPTDAWAVGYGNNYSTLLEHWDGTSWSLVTSAPFGADKPLYGISALSASDVWVSGGGETPFVAHFDGTAWNEVPTVDLGGAYSVLYKIAAVTSNDVWAAGFRETARGEDTLIEHWDGHAWSIVASPHPNDDDYIRSLVAVSASDIWLGGTWFGDEPQYTEHPLLEHWNGSAWSLVASPAGKEPWDFASRGPNDVWMTGDQGNYVTLLEHWDGTTWSVAPSPVGGPGDSELNGATRLPDGTLWAVGSWEPTGSTTDQPLTMVLPAG